MRIGRVVERDAMVDPRACYVRCAVVALESIPPRRSRTRKPINPLHTSPTCTTRKSDQGLRTSQRSAYEIKHLKQCYNRIWNPWIEIHVLVVLSSVSRQSTEGLAWMLPVSTGNRCIECLCRVWDGRRLTFSKSDIVPCHAASCGGMACCGGICSKYSRGFVSLVAFQRG